MASVLAARIRSIPRHARSIAGLLLPIPSVSDDPTNPLAWVDLAQQRLAELPETTRELIQNHDLHPRSRDLRVFVQDIRRNGSDALRHIAAKGISPESIAEAIDEIVRRRTIAQCAYAHRAGGYFSEAEKYIAIQWAKTIWPIIENEDFAHTLDLACGHGRNTELLRRYATMLDLIDVNATCIEACKARFGYQNNGCTFRYHLTDGDGLKGIPSSSLTFVYSWDSMVHFDKLVVRDYVKEIARVLKPNGTAFLHHSNLGAISPNSDWSKNHGSRSDMSAELMRTYADEASLAIKFQRLSGRADGWGMDDLDCLSLLQKRA